MESFFYGLPRLRFLLTVVSGKSLLVTSVAWMIHSSAVMRGLRPPGAGTPFIRCSRKRTASDSERVMTRYTAATVNQISKTRKVSETIFCPSHGEFVDGDGAHQGGVLDERDRLPGQRRQHAADGLGEDDEAVGVTRSRVPGCRRPPTAPGGMETIPARRISAA